MWAVVATVFVLDRQGSTSMNSAVHFASTVLSLVVLAVNCLAQSDQKEDIEFHAPFRTSVADSSQEFRDKYFLGDWMGERSKLLIGASNLPCFRLSILSET